MGRHEWRDDAAPGREDASFAPGDGAVAPWDRPYERGVAALAPGRPGSLRRWGLRGCLILVLAAAAVVGFRLAAGQAQVSSLAVPVVDATVRVPPSAAHPSGRGGADDTPSDSAAGESPTPNGGTGAPSPAGSAPAAGPGLTVHVVGAVKRPGLYHLPEGARVDEAVRAAGGANRGAGLSLLNLAARLVDGTQLRVPAAGEEPAGPYAARSGTEPGGSASPGAGSGVGASGGVVRVNSASQAELETLPGVGPALAQRIIAFRTSHGPLQGEEDLDAIAGIGPAMLEKLRGSVSYD